MLKCVVGCVEVGKLYNKLQCKEFDVYNLLDEAEDIWGSEIRVHHPDGVRKEAFVSVWWSTEAPS